MATIPNSDKFHAVSEAVDTKLRGSRLTNSRKAAYTMADITSTVILNGGGGGLAGAGTTGFLSRWISPTQLGDSDIEKTINYSTPNGGQYELRGNLKIFGEASGSGVAALFVEDSVNAKVQIRDIDNATGNILSELELKSADTFVSIGTTVASPSETILINAQGNTKMRFNYEDINGTQYYCFKDSGNGALGGPGLAGGWEKVFFNLDAYADDAAAGAAGLTVNQLYQTDGTGAAPLNVAGIVMAKQ